MCVYICVYVCVCLMKMDVLISYEELNVLLSKTRSLLPAVFFEGTYFEHVLHDITVSLNCCLSRFLVSCSTSMLYILHLHYSLVIAITSTLSSPAPLSITISSTTLLLNKWAVRRVFLISTRIVNKISCFSTNLHSTHVQLYMTLDTHLMVYDLCSRQWILLLDVC